VSRGCGGAGQAAATRQSADLYGCAGGDHPHDPRPTGEEGDRSLARAGSCHEIEIRWFPAHKDIPGNEIADGWAKQAASEPDDHGVEWLQHADKYGRRSMPPTSLANLRRRASEKKWPEARSWCERRHLNKGYVLRTKGKPDPTPARTEKRTASRYYQLKSGNALTGVYLKSTDNRPDGHC